MELSETAKIECPESLSTNNSKIKSFNLYFMINVSTFICIFTMLLVSFFPIFKQGVYSPTNEFDFGKVKRDETKITGFTVINLHPWSIKVLAVNGDCGCVNTFIDDRHLPFILRPLSSVKFRTSLNTSKRSGVVKQNVTLTSQSIPNQKQETSRFTLTAEIEQ